MKEKNPEKAGLFTKEGLKARAKLYFVDAMGAMALGLFASLLIGTIFNTIGDKVPYLEFFKTVAKFAQGATGMAIGVAIALKLKMPPLVVFSCATVGSIANAMGAIIDGGKILTWAATAKGESGVFYAAGPAGAFFSIIIACEVGKLVSQKTKVDILVTPTVTILTGFAASWLICPIISYVMYYLGVFINTATGFAPIIMGIVISVVVGMILTLPISSAAICSMVFSAQAIEAAVASQGNADGLLLAGGAAAVGCCAQMVGFAVMSFKENRWGGLVSQGLGTSMLQMGNIMKNPRIWLPPTLAGAVVGPLSTTVFKLKCTGVAAGMGTCGLVGPIGIFSDTGNNAMMWVGMILLCIVLPAGISLCVGQLFRKIGWIKENDLKLDQ